ncbi:copper chaperone PCu(A)C [Vibrio sp. D404a]|uniref:copper chaperone PCu(A)C n=1 Tax=unclassified Vibrio TaxID=2614977 RepID=UPI0025536A32|nr:MULTISPECIES: copper chaperone PCu(A)C [unclassified Vibrio]MDK9736142.1 copper chaperone PCu(A)C [Vibrio sp. D404a]MDK9797361.1 copper chaperone PCu(A)C [Vibrio sp. D449a]
MKKQLNTLILFIATLFTAQVFAHEYTADSIQIDHPWSREAPPNATVIAGFFQLKNLAEKDDFLISASTPIADRVEIHTHEMEDGMMKMIKVDNVRLATQETVMFKPGGYHLMIFNPNKPYKKGERFPMTLQFKNAGKVEVELAVEENAHVHHHH